MCNISNNNHQCEKFVTTEITAAYVTAVKYGMLVACSRRRCWICYSKYYV